MESTYKSILIKNKTNDAQVTLYIYPGWDLVCWVSFSSKIIKPGEEYFHRSKDSFQFKLRAHSEKIKKIIQPVTMWEKDKLFSVTGCVENPHVEEEDLSEYHQEKRICIRRHNMEKEIAADCGRNLYEILNLNMEEVRSKEEEEQNKMIKKAYHREMRHWHPDRQQGPVDDHICKEITAAYSILCDPEKRARYNNMARYDDGWTSRKKWKATFWPDCCNNEMRNEWRKRMGLMVLSMGLFIGGGIVTIATAGMAAPIVIGCTVAGGAMIGGGIQSGLRTINRESVENGCNIKDYGKSLAIGTVAGALAGGATCGIAAGLVGIGSTAVQTTGVTIGEYVAVGAATGSAGGAISSVAADLEKKFVDGHEITWKKVACHAIIGSGIGAAAGVVGGAITKVSASRAITASAANIEGEAAEQIAARYGVGKATKFFAKHASKIGSMVEGITEGSLESTATFAEERLDDSTENRPVTEHGIAVVQNILKPVIKNVGQIAAKELAGPIMKKISKPGKQKETQVQTGNTIPQINGNLIELDIEEEDVQVNLNKTKKVENGNLNSEHKVDMADPSKVKIGNTSDEKERCSQAFFNTDIHPPTYSDFDLENVPPKNARIRYISEGMWESKMIIQYTNDKNQVKKRKLSGSGGAINIPENAKDVKVRFQVLRFLGVWCDVKKYDRFKMCWCEPTKPHIFKYEKPATRTFTLSGGLYYEAVMDITDENYDHVSDMF